MTLTSKRPRSWRSECGEVVENVFERLEEGQTALPLIAVPVKLAVMWTREVPRVALADGTGTISVLLTVAVVVDWSDVLADCLEIYASSRLSTYEKRACWRQVAGSDSKGLAVVSDSMEAADASLCRQNL